MSDFSVDTGRQMTPPLVDGVVHNKLVQFAPHGDQTLAQLVVLDSVVVHMLHALFSTFFLLSVVQKLLKSVKIWQSCSQIHTATFYEPRQKCRFNSFHFYQVRCAYKSGDVINFIIVACRISLWLKWYKNCKIQLRLAKVIVNNKMSRFLWFTVYSVYRP